MSITMGDDLPLSMRIQIEELPIGETWPRAARFDADVVGKNVPVMALQAMRNSIQATVKRIADRTGMSFTIEGGEFRTKSRDIIVCLCVTRTG